jgi:ABC-type transport system involved in cytochrome bd biosynthesis fused ATPase/permease subunit
VITHRLTWLDRFDEVVVLEAGRVVGLEPEA